MTTVPHATCLGCGCACDDIEVVTRGGRIVEARQACTIGVAWFGDGQVPTQTRVAGRDATLVEALDAAAHLLATASAPLVYLAPDLSCEAQREAVALADALGATLDTVTSATALRTILAAQERGRAGATLGELRNRADVVVFWGVDPDVAYPRFQARYAPQPEGLHLPQGRRSRTVIAVDVGEARGPSDADLRVAVPADQEVAILTALAEMGTARTDPIEGSSPFAIAQELALVLFAGRYVALVADGEPEVATRSGGAARDTGRWEALVALSLALNSTTRGGLITLRAGGNRSGADGVLTSQTGYPAAVDFSRGFPRYRPYDGSAEARLAAGDVDIAAVLGASARLPAGVLALLARVPCVVVGPGASQSVRGARDVIIDTGVAGIHDGGTAIRMDDVPVPLRPSVEGPPPAAALVRKIRDRIQVQQSKSSGIMERRRRVATQTGGER